MHRDRSNPERGTESSSTASIVFLLFNEGEGATSDEAS
jgi:hypothetical protein